MMGPDYEYGLLFGIAAIDVSETVSPSAGFENMIYNHIASIQSCKQFILLEFSVYLI